MFSMCGKGSYRSSWASMISPFFPAMAAVPWLRFASPGQDASRFLSSGFLHSPCFLPYACFLLSEINRM